MGRAGKALRDGGKAVREGGGGDYGLFVGCGGYLSKQVSNITGQKVSGTPRLMLLNIPDGSFYYGPEGEQALSAESVAAFAADVAAGRLTRHVPSE